MKDNKIEITYVPIDSLIPSEYNPRKASEKEWNDLLDSIRSFGLVDPIVVNSAENRKNIIIGGHFRCKGAKALHITEVPVVYVNIPNEEEERELNLRLNKNLGAWDFDILANFNDDLLRKVGFDSQELEKMFGISVDERDDEVSDVQKEPQSKLGDLYILGKHRVLCGDSTKREDVEKLMDGKKADMVFTDPPYGMRLNTDYSGMKGWHQGKKYDKVLGDNQDFDNNFINNIFLHFDYVKEKFLFGADYYVDLLPNYGKNGNWIVWDKRIDESKDKMFGSGFEMLWSQQKHQRRLLRGMWAGFMGDTEASKRQHPTQKPTKILVEILQEYSTNKDIILDLFLGSGSTLIAAEKTGRICFGMEIDPRYIDVIVSRYCKYTGNNNVIKNEEEIEWELEFK